MSRTLPLLERLRLRAERCGVRYATAWNFDRDADPNDLQLSCLQRYGAGVPGARANPRVGAGAVHLLTLLRFADWMHRGVVLFTNVPRLYAWYESFGFYEYREREGRLRYYRYEALPR